MIELDKFSQFSDKTIEGKLLLSAISALTSLTKEDIDKVRYGGSSNPDCVFREIVEIANKVYYEEEYKAFKLKQDRDNKVNKLLEK